MKFLEHLLEQLLFSIQGTTGLSWAWSIIGLTALVRVAILPLTAGQTRSMLAMQRLQPHLAQLKEQYKDDKQELNLKIMEFYRINKVNPLASCLPLLLQMPVFFALFFVLKDIKPPKGASQDFSFLFNFVENIRVDINDGGVAGWALLLFYVASQMFASYVMATSPDPRQRMLFLVMPIVFVPFILNLPIGLMLYWTTTNFWTLGQHLIIVRLTDTAKPVIMPEDAKGRHKEILPKAAKAELRRRGQDKPGKDAKSPGGGSSTDEQSAPARRNKRRR